MFLLRVMLITIVAASVYLPAAWPHALVRHSFSESERAALERSKVVVRAKDQEQIGWTAFMRINAPPDAVWRALTNYAEHPNYMPAILVSEATPQIGPSTLSLYTVYDMPWPMVDVYMRSKVIHDESNPRLRRMIWQAEQTNLKSAQGHWEIIADDPGTLLVYDLDFDVEYFPRILGKELAHLGILFALPALRDHVIAASSSSLRTGGSGK